MKIISDASPIIFLAKIGKLNLLETHDIIIPKQVYEEIHKGVKVGKEDAYKIESLIDSNRIKVEDVTIQRDIAKQNLGKGEMAAISLAINKKVSLILLDERKARRIAKFYSLKPRGALGILMEAHSSKELSKQQLMESIQKLVKEGYRIREEFIIELLNKLK